MSPSLPSRSQALSIFTLTVALASAPAALGQFGNAWLTLTQAQKLVKPAGGPADIVASSDEKDFAVGDVNKDGWDDLVVAKKVQSTFVGPREGRLFLNEQGLLVDHTAQYASASLSSALGDDGFKEPLDATDVELGDLDGDGWLDLISIQIDLTNNTASAAKRLTHPRVYMNLGEDASGNWLGFLHDDARIPQLLTIPTGLNGSIRFADGALGDCDNDGDLDLYCVDFDTDENGHAEPSSIDLNDRLLINDGFGFFTDQTATRFANSGMWSSAYGSDCDFADMNGDGKQDIVKVSWLTDNPNRTEAIYNDILATAPNFTGGYDSIQSIDTGENVTMANADLNNDGRLDHLVGDCGVDHYRFNTGNSAIGQVVWSPPLNFTWLTGSGDDGLPGNTSSVDYDLDGWNDALITDVIQDLAGCNRRTKIYHNRGGVSGATNIVLAEEKQQSGSGGWFGVVGWSTTYPKGVNDVGNIDIDHDGDLDLVLGRCAGADVWMNETNPVICQESVVPTSSGDGSLAVCGQPLWSNLSATLSIANGPALGTALLLVDLDAGTAPALGGQILFPFALALAFPLDASGALSFPVPGGLGTAEGLDVYAQALLFATGTQFPTDVTNVVRIALHN